MALTKQAAASRPAITRLIQNEISEVPMGIDPAAVGHILDRLTDMYPDPIQASVREVISNAHDATVLLPEAERKPIRVILPSMLNPMFSVQDYGVGMSRDTVEQVYSQYGSSTKKDDMSQIGAYGLGAKAPLAYCTEFFGETTHEGITTNFKVSRESRGNFTTVLGEEVTNRESGTKISLPTSSHDQARFQESVRYYSEYSFSCPIEINGTRVAEAPYFQLDTPITLDKDSGVQGRVWVHRDRVVDLLMHHLRGVEPGWAAVLSGWLYRVPGVGSNRNGYARSQDGKPFMLVELKPGVVDFSSSRDAITHNVRASDFRDVATAYLAQDEVREALFSAYRKLDDGQARQVVWDLFESGMSLDRGQVTLSGGPRGSTTTPVETFVTDTGYNPIPLFIGDKPNVCGGGLHTRQAYSEVGYFTRWSRGNTTARANVATTSEALAKTLETPCTYSLFDVARSSLQSYGFGRHQSYHAPAKYIFISDASPSDVAFITSSRATLYKSLAHQDTYLILCKNGEEVKAQIAELATHNINNLQHYTASEYRAFVKDLRLQLRKPKDLVLNVTLILSEVPAIPELSSVEYSVYQLTPAEIMEEGAILVVDDNTSRAAALPVVIGAHNAGLKVEGRPVYTLNGNMTGAFAEQFDSYPYLLLHPQAAKQSKAMKALGETNTYYARIADEKLTGLKPKALVRAHFRDHNLNQEFIEAYTSFLAASGAQDLAESFTAAVQSSYKEDEDSHFYNRKLRKGEATELVTRDQLLKLLPIEKCGPAVALKDGFESLRAKQGSLQESLRDRLLYRGPSGEDCDAELEAFFYGQAMRASQAILKDLQDKA